MPDRPIPSPAPAIGGPPAAAAGPEPYRWVIVAVVLFAVTTAFFDRINVAVLFTDADFKQALGITNPAMLGLLMTSFVFAYGASAVMLSVTSDVFGPRRMLSLIALVLAVAMGLMGGAASYGAMLTGRVVLGIAEGPQFGTANVAIKRWFASGRRGFATASWTIGGPLGSMIGFPFVIFLVAQYGWRASFYVLAALNGLIVLPVVWLLLRDGPAQNIVAAPRAPSDETLPFGVAIKILLGSGRFWLLAIYDCGAMIYLWGFNSWLPAYLTQARHFDVTHSALFSSFPFLVMLAGNFFGGWLGDRLRSKAWICQIGLLMAGLSILAGTQVEDAVAAALLLALSAGFWGMTVPTLFAMGTEIIPGKVTSMGFGIYAGIANLVGAAAPLLIGILIGQSGNYTAGLLVIVVSCVVLSFAMVPLLRRY
jgi:sugar phosphate permease